MRTHNIGFRHIRKFAVLDPLLSRALDDNTNIDEFRRHFYKKLFLKKGEIASYPFSTIICRAICIN